jgi:hypothetical protein
MTRRQSGSPPEPGAARSVVSPMSRADCGVNTRTAVPTRELFDGQPIAESAGHVLLEWIFAPDGGSRLGFARVRLPNVAYTDLFVSFHWGRGRHWAEADPDTPRRCRRRLERALPLLCQLIAGSVGGEAIGRMLRQRGNGGEP